MRRREFLIVPVSAVGTAFLRRLRGIGLGYDAESVRVPLRFFTEAEARVVVAACERIFPRDASGPGATDAGVTIYIDRQLAGPYGRDKYRYTREPFADSVPEHGYQGRATPREVYREGIRRLGDFAALTAEQQDAALHAIEGGYFFRLLRTHTIEGMFSDPAHGGNANLVGWQLIGYPGPRPTYREQIDKHYGVAYRPAPMSVRQAMGMPLKPWEEEQD